MANPFGRSVILPLTNQSGASVAAGDVLYLATGFDDAFITGTTANYTGPIGIAQQTIGAGSVGLVLVSGYASLVNVNAAVTRGHYGATFTAAKQATDAGASRAAGTFCQFLKAGTTPDAVVWQQPDLGAGSGMTNPMTAVGDIIQGTTAGAPAALAAPLVGKVLTGAGVTTSVAYKYPPGYEFDYAEFTAPVSVTATTEATANVIVSSNAVTYDGATIVLIEFGTDYIQPDINSGIGRLWLYEQVGGGAAASIGELAVINGDGGTSSGSDRHPVFVRRRRTPSAASIIYSVRGSTASGTMTVDANVGGAGSSFPGYIRVVKVSGGA